MFKKISVLSLILIFCLSSLAFCEEWSRVKRVIDGDTIVLSDNQRVRYIGINTPETKHPSKAAELFGREAYKFNKKLVEGKKVRLEFDAEKYDRYDRLLAYVYLEDGTFVNAEIIKQGYAYIYTVPPNVKYADLFLKLQQQAREKDRGLWGHQETYRSTEPYYIGNKRSRKFHKPTCRSLPSPRNRVYFKTKSEALDAGFSGCGRCNP